MIHSFDSNMTQKTKATLLSVYLFVSFKSYFGMKVDKNKCYMIIMMSQTVHFYGMLLTVNYRKITMEISV